VYVRDDVGNGKTDDPEKRALEAAIDARDRFISIAAHDLKTPLSAMQLHAQMLLRGLDKPGGVPRDKLVTKLEAIRRQVGKLAVLIDDMLDVSRIVRGRIDLEPTDTDVAALVREAVAARATTIEDSGSTVEVTAPDALVGRWDARRLRQIVGHLLDNALGFAPGAIEARVSAQEQLARIEIIDHGPGIADDEQELIFQPFIRGATATTEGVGLGLWMARVVSEAMGGTLQLKSAPGQGAQFVIELPL
jgi:signal transduction histidine kinase